MKRNPDARRRVTHGLAALAAGTAALLTAACTSSTPPAASARHNLAAAGSASVVPAGPSAQASGQATARPAVITLSPAQRAQPAALSAAATVIRRRATLLGLPDLAVTVSGQHLVLTGPEPSQSQLAALVDGGTLDLRPVLLSSPSPGMAAPAFGDPGLVQPAVMKLFGKLTCPPGPDAAGTVSDSWKATVGYSAAAQWDAPGSQVVSCNSSGTRYVLGTAVVTGTQVTAAQAAQSSAGAQWTVDLNLNSAGANAFGAYTTRQSQAYAQGATAGSANDQALDSTGFALNGDVIAAPETAAPVLGGQLEVSQQPDGFTQALATEVTAQLASGPLPVTLQVTSIKAA